MMIKVITPHSKDFGESVSSLIKVSSKGLVGSDLSSFVKRLLDAEMYERLAEIKKTVEKYNLEIPN